MERTPEHLELGVCDTLETGHTLCAELKVAAAHASKAEMLTRDGQ